MASLTGTTEVRKASDETVNNSDTLQNDDDLVIAMGANETWIFEGMFLYDTGVTPNIDFAFTVPAAATIKWQLLAHANANDARWQATATSSGAEKPAQGLGAGTSATAWVKGIVRVGANAGNLQLQWAQNTQDASDTKLLTDSWLMAAREA